MAIKFQDSLEVKGGSASKIYLEGAGGTGSSTILQAYNPDDGAGHAGGTAYLKSSGWGEAQLAVGSYRWTQAGGKMTVTGGVYYFNTGNVGIKQPNPTVPLEVIGTIKQKTGSGYTNYVQQSVSEAQITFDTYSGNQSVHPNAFKFSHNGSEALIIDKDSNVGIGNYTPESRLHIYQNAAAPTLLTLHNYQGDITPNGTQGNFIDLKMTDNNATFTPQVRIGMLVQDYDGDQGMPSEGTGNFVVYTGDGTDSSGNGTLTEKLRVTHQGAVGINQSNPEHRLDIVSSSANVLGLTNTSNGTGTTITFNDNPTANQRVYLTAHHVDGQSHGGGASLHLTSTEANVTMVSERYKSIQHGDSSQWSAAYSWGDHSAVGYLRTRPEVHTALYSTGGNADEYTEFGIYRNYAEGGPITSHNTILNVMQQDGRYGFQLGANTQQEIDGLYYRSKDAAIGPTWYQVASRDWVSSQGYLTSLPAHTHSAADITSGTLDGARLPWQTNDDFGGTYPIVWKATGSGEPYTSSWLNVNGTTDTLHARNIHADGKITSTGPITVNNRTAISVAHWSRSNNSTGAIKIKLPGLHNSNNWSMIVLRITTYEYNSNEHTIYYVSGHDWTSGWYNKKVTIIGESDKPVFVTYSESANEDYVIIGDPASTWSYGHVTVDVMAHPSFYSSAMDISTGWTIEQIEDLGDIELHPVETKRVANEQWVIDQGYITDITTQTDPKYLRSDTSDTMSGNLLVASQTQTDSTTKAEMLTNAVAKFKPHALNSGSLAIAQVDSGNAVGMQFTNGSGTADWDISLQPFGGRVGIGTTTPAALLDVDGTAQMSSGITENTHYVGVSVQHWGDGGTGMYFNTDSVDIRTNSVTRIEFNNSGVSIPSDVYFTGNSRKIYLTGGDTNSQNGWIVGEQDRYGFGATWDSGLSILFQGWDGRNVTDTHNKDLGSVNIRDRVWNFLGSARLNNNDLATEAWVEEQPPAPAAASCAVVGDTVEVSFDPAPESPDYYQVWASQDGGSYSLIAQIPTQDFSPFMTVVDTSFSVSGLRAYRVYAVRRGIYSDPATTSRTYTQAALEPVNMNVVPMEESFFVQWDAPASRFVDHYEVYLDTHADQGSLNRNNANLVYSGNNTFYMHPASTNEFHQFWVEIAES